MEKSFQFNLLESGVQLSPEHKELLMKWGLDRSLSKHKFNFDQPMQIYEIENFIYSLLRSQAVSASLGIAGLVCCFFSSKASWFAIRVQNEKIDFENETLRLINWADMLFA